jgi:ABC-type antimicrobial peptide transport system permease subunit
MAMGASPRAIVGMVLAQTARTTAMGLGSGLLVAGALTAFMSHVLYHVVAIEPLAFVGITAMLAASALLAAYLPARRAARVDPMTALRSE